MSRCRCLTLSVALAVGPAATVAHAAVLLDNGSTLGGGRAISAQWTIFQPLTVPDPGWHVTSIAVDGFVDIDPDTLGMLGKLLGDDGTGQPDEANSIAEAKYFMAPPTFPASSQWRDEAYDVVLAPGQYWMRWSVTDGDLFYFGAVWRAPVGENSYSRNEFTGQIFNSDPTALRIFGTLAAEAADMNCDGSVDSEDIDPFFLALGNPADYMAAFPACDLNNADVNGDAAVDAEDIDPFFVCLAAGGCP